MRVLNLINKPPTTVHLINNVLFRRCLDADYDVNEQRYINNKGIKKSLILKNILVRPYLTIDAKFD